PLVGLTPAWTPEPLSHPLRHGLEPAGAEIARQGPDVEPGRPLRPGPGVGRPAAGGRAGGLGPSLLRAPAPDRPRLAHRFGDGPRAGGGRPRHPSSAAGAPALPARS